MSAKLRWLLLATLATLAACVTINVYFPAAEAQQAAREFVDDVIGRPDAGNGQGEDSDRDSGGPAGPDPVGLPSVQAPRLRLQLVASAQAQADITIRTPAIQAIRERMRARFGQLRPHFDSGALGMTRDGHIAVRTSALPCAIAPRSTSWWPKTTATATPSTARSLSPTAIRNGKARSAPPLRANGSCGRPWLVLPDAGGNWVQVIDEKRREAPVVELVVDDLSHDGRGVARHEGKVVFVADALPGERVRAQLQRRRRDFDEAALVQVLEPSPDRVTPRCEHFGTCGGCVLQHLAPAAQIAAKQRQLLENFRRLADLAPARVLPPLTADVWHYRRKARLSVRLVEKKGRVLAGFRERNPRYVADIRRCEVLDARVGPHIHAIGDLVGTLDSARDIAQIEVAAGQEMPVLVFRHLAPLTAADRERLAAFGQRMQFAIHLQPGGVDSVHPLWPEDHPLYFTLPRHQLRYDFLPLDFVQVNHSLNQAMVDQALGLLAPRPEERVLDLFCGLGNFSLPLARHAAGGGGGGRGRAGPACPRQCPPQRPGQCPLPSPTWPMRSAVALGRTGMTRCSSIRHAAVRAGPMRNCALPGQPPALHLLPSRQPGVMPASSSASMAGAERGRRHVTCFRTRPCRVDRPGSTAPANPARNPARVEVLPC